MKNLIVASTSTIHGGTYLSYLFPEIAQLFSETEEVLFIPYARPSGISHNKYTEIAQEAFSKIGKKVIGIHSIENPVEAVKNSKGIFIGGGNACFADEKTLEAITDAIATLRNNLVK